MLIRKRYYHIYANKTEDKKVTNCAFIQLEYQYLHIVSFLPLIGCGAVIEIFLELCSVRKDLVNNELSIVLHFVICTQGRCTQTTANF